MKDKDILIQYRIKKNKECLIPLFLKYKDMLGQQFLNQARLYIANPDISDYADQIYEVIKYSANLFRCYEREKAFIKRTVTRNTFMIKKRIKEIVLRQNKVKSCDEMFLLDNDKTYEANLIEQIDLEIKTRRFMMFIESQNLTKREKRIIIMKYKGYHENEIAKASKIKVNNVHYQLKKILSKFQEMKPEDYLNNKYNKKNG
jgi:DNA-binding CsgD family transcriptional regulator